MASNGEKNAFLPSSSQASLFTCMHVFVFFGAPSPLLKAHLKFHQIHVRPCPPTKRINQRAERRLLILSIAQEIKSAFLVSVFCNVCKVPSDSVSPCHATIRIARARTSSLSLPRALRTSGSTAGPPC